MRTQFFLGCATNLYSTAMFSQDFPSIAHATDLLKSMQTNASFQRGAPSENVVTFLSRLENADPASPEISEDDNNAAWGHYQFTASSLTCTSVLTSWDAVGNVVVACRLIAAAIKTCKVARHLCFSNHIETTSYLSDIYLANVINLLWQFWQEAVGINVSDTFETL